MKNINKENIKAYETLSIHERLNLKSNNQGLINAINDSFLNMEGKHIFKGLHSTTQPLFKNYFVS